MMRWDDEIEQLVRKFGRTWGRRMGFGREDTEDFEQEAVCQSFVKIVEGKIISRHGLWSLVRNVAFDFRRRLGRDALCVDSDQMGSYSIDGLVMSRLQFGEIEVSHPELVALAEARASGYSWDEIGIAFGIPTTTLRKRWLRLCRAFANEFGKELSQIDKSDRL